MLIFLDTANVQAIEECLALRIVDGITTNPTLLAKTNGKPLDIIKQILTVFPHGIINVEITESDPQKAYAQALKIRELGNNVVVKIPAHKSYLPLIARLVQEKIPVNTTLVFSVAQAALMGKLNVQYISPFVGRLYDNGVDGIETLKTIINCFTLYGFSTKVLAASLRNIEQINAAVALGVDIITISPSLLQQMCSHQLTDQGIQQFTTDWHGKDDELFE